MSDHEARLREMADAERDEAELKRTAGLPKKADAAEAMAETLAAGADALAEGERLRAERDTLRAALSVIERRLREDAAPLVALVNAHGGPAERRAWKAVYSSAVHAQGTLRDRALARDGSDR